MSFQLKKFLTVVALVGVIFLPCFSNADVSSDEQQSTQGSIQDMQNSAKDFVDSLVKDVKAMSPLKIVGVFVVMLLLAVMFRGIIVFVLMFAILGMMFGGTEKVTAYLKENFSFMKSMPNMEDLSNAMSKKGADKSGSEN
ncbi:MAG: hypothetical protein QWI36_04315 [Wolbachia endosymbiont of Tyrophagus putrescentiae]|nr:hypothetical protein [Wolbachia endosymbiont of Tyrophagus putrescentiae]